jgi:predicted nucleic acid-binding protein
VSEEPAFCDSSALVPRCVLQASSQSLRQLGRRYGVVVWWATRVEVRSAIVRLYRLKEITQKERAWGEARLRVLQASWKEIVPSEELRESAEQLLEKYRLRAADSFQLAAALMWCRGRAAKRVFLCGDARLSEAARAEGFAVVELWK